MYEARLSEFRQLLIDHNLDAALVTAVPNIFYLTGYSGFSLEEREAYLLISANSTQPQGSKTPGVGAYILTDGRYVTAVKEAVKHFTLVEIGSRYSMKKAFEKLVTQHAIKKLGIEENNLFVYEYKTFLPFVKETMHVPAAQLRIKKNLSEIDTIAQTCKIGDEAFSAVLKIIKPGMSEKEVAFHVENNMREHDAEPSFRTIVGFDENAAVPHHMTGEKKLGTNGLVLIDSGAKVNNYCSDMTRTVFVGIASADQKKMYQTVLTAQQKAVLYIQEALKKQEPVSAGRADSVAREYILSQGYPTIPHSLGHGIGLEVHEAPTLSPVSQHQLEEGMVFSIEPGIYLPGNAGVRIEDLYVIQNNSLRQLTQSPKNLIEL
jgi:Xaa-Pro aminopeptidase